MVLLKNNFYEEINLKNPKTLRKCKNFLRPQMPELRFLKTLIFPKALLKLQNLVNFNIKIII